MIELFPTDPAYEIMYYTFFIIVKYPNFKLAILVLFSSSIGSLFLSGYLRIGVSDLMFFLTSK